MNTNISIFNEERIRRVWDGKNKKWYFSVVDKIAVLTGSSIPKRYLSDLKRKLKDEKSEVYDKIVQLKMIYDGETNYSSQTVTNCNQLKKSVGDKM